ncbi:hypothetical protein NGF19_08890 [Streptomyces sp. RY43-2]|uniref:Secreted protein n=1 Tax=Streptomyces macrolidinus TaxID=2952607 RepID=A0ABT0ZAW2_9ACTN|nr:hypothetical protein [Streptomyces macrolidinus]MCN9240909.1 hypothetical protein [Streptomyces macrolidinus]
MQHPVVPELAHATTRPLHWIITAAAVSSVIALSSLFQPGPATAAQPSHRAKTPATAAAPDPADADFPLQCGTAEPVVKQQATGDLDGDGRPETVAVVHCDAGMGSPPDGIYVLTRAADSPKPRVVATLVDPEDRLTVTDFALRDAAVTATLVGYSSPDVPSCCPDRKTPAKWHWNNGAFIRSTPSEARSV